MSVKSHRFWTGVFLILTPILFMAAFTLLQKNFEYPDILRQPAAIVMEKFAATATTFGVVAGVVQMLGFMRWPFLVPGLASTYVDPSTSEATRAAIEMTFTVVLKSGVKNV